MRQSNILQTLRTEEVSLKRQLAAVQRAIEAISDNAEPKRSPGRPKATATAAKRPRKGKKPLTDEQRTAISERMRKYWSDRRAAAAAKATDAA